MDRRKPIRYWRYLGQARAVREQLGPRRRDLALRAGGEIVDIQPAGRSHRSPYRRPNPDLTGGDTELNGLVRRHVK